MGQRWSFWSRVGDRWWRVVSENSLRVVLANVAVANEEDCRNADRANHSQQFSSIRIVLPSNGFFGMKRIVNHISNCRLPISNFRGGSQSIAMEIDSSGKALMQRYGF